MTDLQIRTAVLADAENVLAFWKEAAEGTSITDDVNGVTRLINRDPEALILAESDGVLVGSVIAGWDGWRASLYRLAVLPARRRQGVASALLEAAEQRFAEVGGDAVTRWSWRRTNGRTGCGRRPATSVRTAGGGG